MIVSGKIVIKTRVALLVWKQSNILLIKDPPVNTVTLGQIILKYLHKYLNLKMCPTDLKILAYCFIV